MTPTPALSFKRGNGRYRLSRDRATNWSVADGCRSKGVTNRQFTHRGQIGNGNSAYEEVMFWTYHRLLGPYSIFGRAETAGSVA
jgi:hypothetical protein